MRVRGFAVGLAVVVVVVSGAAALLLSSRGGDKAPPAGHDAGTVPARAHATPARPAATARVAGTVRAGELPVSRATVRLEIGAIPQLATTDGFGRFELFGVPIASGTIEAAADGFAGDSQHIDLRTPAGALAAERLELLLTGCADELFGDVRDVAGAPLAGAEIRATGRAGRTLGRVVADGEGRYRLCVGSWRLTARVSVPGYATEFRFIRPAGSTRVDFRLGPEAIIEGRVVDDVGEQAGAGAEVRYGMPWSYGTVRCDEAGEFRISGLSPGRHRLHASAGDVLTTLAPTDVEVRVGVATPPVVLRMGRSHLLSGRVVDGAGRPIPGEQVRAVTSPLANLPIDAVSDEDGRFLLGPLVAGRTTLTLASEAEEPREVVVPHEGEVLLMRRASAWLRGRVMRKRRPVAGATLELDPRISVGESRADGSFEIGPIAAGSRVVTAFDRELGEGTLAVTVADGEKVDGLVVELAPGATVSGTVVDQHGAPVAGVRVSLWEKRGAEHGNAATGADGSFTVRGLSGQGDFKVSVLGSGFGRSLGPAGAPFPPVHLDDDHPRIEGLRLAVRLEKGTIGGVVRRSSGEPVADASVSVTSGFMSPLGAETITDERGRFELTDLLDGTVDLQASTSDAVKIRVNDVAVGSRDVVLTLPATGTLRGELVGFARRPQVIVASARGTFVPSYFPAAGPDGFIVEDLVAGEYRVRARAGGELDEATVTVPAGGQARVTLRSGGAARIVVAALAAESGTPVVGALCGLGLASDAEGAVLYDRTDAAGRLVLDAPAGKDLAISCKPDNSAVEQEHPVHRRLAPGETATVTVTLSRRAYLGLKIAFDGDTPVVEQVSGPAEAAGVLPGDIIAAIEDESVLGVTRATFYGKLLSRAPGTVLRLSLARGGASVAAQISVGRMPDVVAFGEL